MNKETNFRYEIGGKLTPIDDPMMPDEEESKGMDRLGFTTMDELGDEHSFTLTVYANLGEEKRWFLSFYDNFTGCLIEVVGWPAYIDALRYFSPIVGMSQHAMTTRQLEEIKKTLQA
jgi:hypothetical protein